jgi:hypothetical protein
MSDAESITEADLRRELISFARLVLTLDAHGALADRSASLLRLLGDLRSMVFEFELSCTDPDAPVQARNPKWRALQQPLDNAEARDELVRRSERIVREASELEQQARRSWTDDDAPRSGDES